MDAGIGRFLAVDEEQILPGRDQLSRRGFYVEATSAIVWDALAQISDQVPEPILAREAVVSATPSINPTVAGPAPSVFVRKAGRSG